MVKGAKDFKRADEKLARQFLRERNLLTPFNRFKRLKGVIKKRFTVKQDDVSHRIVAHRQGDRIILREADSLQILATTKRFNLRNIQTAFFLRKEKALSLRSKKSELNPSINKRIGTILSNNLRLKEISRIPLTNVVQIDRTAPLRKTVGKLFISVTFFGKRKQEQTVEGGSREQRLLGIPSEQRRAFNQAFEGALSEINFSYETFRVNWIHFSYFVPNKRPQPIFQFKETIRAV